MGQRIASLADVDVYRIARALARDIDRQAGAGDGESGEDGPFAQIRALAQTVCRHIAQEFETQTSGPQRDFGAFLLRARTACAEMAIWVSCAQAQALVPSACAESWGRSCARIGGMLEALYTYKPSTVAEAA